VRYVDAARADHVCCQPGAGMLWERAAQAAVTNAGYAATVDYAGRARDYHFQHNQARAAARAQATAGEALLYWGRHAEAGDQLTAALEVLPGRP